MPWLGTAAVDAGADSADARWTFALMGASTGVLLAGTLLAMAWRPLAKPLPAQFLLAGIVVDVCIEVPFRGAGYLVLALPAVAAVAAYPRLRSLTAMRVERGFPLVFTVVGVVLLARVAVTVREAVTRDSLGWVDDAAHLSWIALGALLAVTGRPGWRVLATLVGAVLCYLAVVSWVVPEAAGSWGPVSAGLAGAAGLGYLIAAGRPRRSGIRAGVLSRGRWLIFTLHAWRTIPMRRALRVRRPPAARTATSGAPGCPR